MTHLGEPQSAAGVPVLFLGIGLINLDWLGWMNFSRRALEKPAIT
jgi:hypothetical protein